MDTFDSVSRLPLRIESCRLKGMRLEKGAFTRHTTVVHLEGDGHVGCGEDVTYEAPDQHAFRVTGAPQLAGEYTLARFSDHLERVDFWPERPQSRASRDYRRWAFESAALDLALRQAGRSLPEVLGIVARPVRFVASLSLGSPPSLAPVHERLERYPELEFKVDWSDKWTPEFMRELNALAPIRCVDLKGHYRGTPVDQAPVAEGYALVAECFPDAWIEDPMLNGETTAALASACERITWDAPIHSVEDIEALPFTPKAMNIKPSRFGTLRRLFDALDHCEAEGIECYGGGQFELGPGRGQLHVLASLFYPDACNDIAPTAYHANQLPDALPRSPLELSIAGFRTDSP